MKGFTLIELVIVLVIVSVLSAVAVTRFIDLGKTARIASLQVLAAQIQSAVVLAKAKYIIEGNGPTSTANKVTMWSTTVRVVPGSGMLTANTLGIRKAMRAIHGFTITYDLVGKKATFNFNSPLSNCKVVYKENDGETIISTGGC